MKMSSLKQTLVKTSGLLAALAASDNSNVSVVTTDTLVIGGGAGGAHAAVRLTDYGQDVILVERQPILVGLTPSADRAVLEALTWLSGRRCRQFHRSHFGKDVRHWSW